MIEKIREANAGYESGDTSVVFLYLLACGVQGAVPDRQKIKGADLRKVFGMSEYHSLSALVYMALDMAKAFDDSDQELAQKWKEMKEKAVRKNILLDTMRLAICRDCEMEGIWYLPLKGVVLKDMYPKTGMRQMADNDILYDSNFQQNLKEIMKKKGFHAKSVGQSNHDTYEKKPVYNFEMHTALYGSEHDQEWVRYYSDVKERLILDENFKFGYHFSDEDFYIYLITHACKHFSGGGTGIRSLLDIYVFLSKKETSLDWDYMSGEMKKLQVAEFERDSRELAKKLFSDKLCVLTEKEAGLLEYFLGSGTYGTLENHVENKMHKYQVEQQGYKDGTKKKYIVNRLFPGEEHYRSYAPFAYRHKWARPCYIVFRAVRGVLRNGRKIAREIWLVAKMK